MKLQVFLDRKRERDRQKHHCEKHQSVASCRHPDWGWHPQPGHVPCPGIKPSTFWCARPCSSQQLFGQGCLDIALRMKLKQCKLLKNWACLYAAPSPELGIFFRSIFIKLYQLVGNSKVCEDKLVIVKPLLLFLMRSVER